jgi:hypothetical protein
LTYTKKALWPNAKYINVLFPIDVFDRISTIASEEDRSLGQVLRLITKEYFKQLDAKNSAADEASK